MPNKALGQHWLSDRTILKAIAASADLKPTDTVLEVGPGLGSLTSVLLPQVQRVIAVEFDEKLARALPKQFPGTSLSVVHQDILSFDLRTLPPGYKVVANIPYYITNKIVQLLLTSAHPPSISVLLVQKEVAERLAAFNGKHSVLSISAQLFSEVCLGDIVPAAYFTPVPKVDSQIVILKTRPQPIVPLTQQKVFFRVVKAGFSAKRKKLRSSLSAGLHLSKQQAEDLLQQAGVDPNVRAEDISISDWKRLSDCDA